MGTETLYCSKGMPVTENSEWNVLTSVSGRFEVDSAGLLRNFTAAGDNQVEHRCFLPVKCESALKHLHIPEGVRMIRPRSVKPWVIDFSDTLVLGDVSFPETLVSIGHHAFSGCVIGRVLFPPSLKRIGRGSFMQCLIRCLEIE